MQSAAYSNYNNFYLFQLLAALTSQWNIQHSHAVDRVSHQILTTKSHQKLLPQLLLHLQGLFFPNWNSNYSKSTHLPKLTFLTSESSTASPLFICIVSLLCWPEPAECTSKRHHRKKLRTKPLPQHPHPRHLPHITWQSPQVHCTTPGLLLHTSTISSVQSHHFKVIVHPWAFNPRWHSALQLFRHPLHAHIPQNMNLPLDSP